MFRLCSARIPLVFRLYSSIRCSAPALDYSPRSTLPRGDIYRKPGLYCEARLEAPPGVSDLFAPHCLHGIEPGGADGGDQAGDEAHSMISLVGAQDNVSSIAKSHLSLVMVNATAGFRPKPACAGGSSNSS